MTDRAAFFLVGDFVDTTSTPAVGWAVWPSFVEIFRLVFLWLENLVGLDTIDVVPRKVLVFSI